MRVTRVTCFYYVNMLPKKCVSNLGGSIMFTLDIIFLDILKNFYNEIFPWSDYAFYGFGVYAKFIIVLFMLQQCFNIIYVYKVRKGGGSK